MVGAAVLTSPVFGSVQGGNIAKVALWSSSQRKNGKFEVNELNNDWGK